MNKRGSEYPLASHKLLSANGEEFSLMRSGMEVQVQIPVRLLVRILVGFLVLTFWFPLSSSN